MKSIYVMMAALTMSALAACGSDSATSPNSTVGTYVLVSVNGETLPATIVNAGDTVVVVGDTVVLNANLTYTRDLVDILEHTGLAATTYQHMTAGTYVQTDTMVTFTNSTDHTTVTGKLVNGVATISDVEDGFSVTGVFHKQ